MITDWELPAATDGNIAKFQAMLEENPEITCEMGWGPMEVGKPLQWDITFSGPESLVTDFVLKLKSVDWEERKA